MKSSKVAIRVPPVTCCPTQLLNLLLVNSALVGKKNAEKFEMLTQVHRLGNNIIKLEVLQMRNLHSFVLPLLSYKSVCCIASFW